MIQSDVYLEPIAHKYFDHSGREFTSVSKVLESLSEKVDWVAVAGKVAGRGKFSGMSKAEVLKLWDDNRDKAANHGTRIHKILEDYGQTFSVEDESMLPLAKSIHAEYSEYHQTYDEVCLYSDEHGIAGTADKILLPYKNKMVFDLCDYKTNLSGFTINSKDNKYMLGPASHLQECMLNKYSIQLSLYCYMYEKLTNYKVRNLWITYIPPEDHLRHHRFYVPYMKELAVEILDSHARKSKLVSTTEPIDISYPIDLTAIPDFGVE